MGKANIGKQILIQTKNEAGQFAAVTLIMADAGVNIRGICAWGMQDKAFFAVLASDNAKAISAMTQKGLDAKEQEVVTMMLEDTLGAAGKIAQKIKNAGINLEYVYGTTCGCNGSEALLVLISKDTVKLVSCLNA